MIKDNYYSQKISRIQFVCSVLIVILHSNNINGYNLISDGTVASRFVLGVEEFISVLGHCAVPTFFTISAFLFFRCFDLKSYKVKIHKRIKTLLVPYLIWNTIGVIFFAVLTNLPFVARHMNQGRVDLNPIDLIVDVVLSTYTPLWYVRNLMVYFVIAPIMYILVRKKSVGIFSILIGILFNIFMRSTYYSLQNWLPMFMFGGWVATHYSDLIVKSTPNTFKASRKYILFAFIALYLMTFVTGNDPQIIYLYRCISPIAVWIAFDYFKPVDTVKWWQKFSFFIYCSHFFMVSSLQKIALLLWGNGWVSAFIVYCLTPPIVLLIIFAVARFMQKKLPKLWGVLNGGRG